MDPSLEKQTQIEVKRLERIEQYPALWSRIIDEWKKPGPQDWAWLTYSANYLFRTGNIRWAIDPLTLPWRIVAAEKVDVARDLEGLSFVLLTHRHEDHLDLDLISALRDFPIRWIVPETLLSIVMEQAGLPPGNMIVPEPLKLIELDGLTILPFEGLHWERSPSGKPKGVSAMAYLVEMSGKRWLFPGDTRIYDAGKVPELGKADLFFAHLWLGRHSAQLDHPPLLHRFCQFCVDLSPRQVIITHLEELGRSAKDYWDARHVELVRAHFKEISPHLQISTAFMGDRVEL